jgi:hypothetical protein
MNIQDQINALIIAMSRETNDKKRLEIARMIDALRLQQRLYDDDTK